MNKCKMKKKDNKEKGQQVLKKRVMLSKVTKRNL